MWQETERQITFTPLRGWFKPNWVWEITVPTKFSQEHTPQIESATKTVKNATISDKDTLHYIDTYIIYCIYSPLRFFTNIIKHSQPLVHFAAPYVPSLWLVNPSWRAFAAKSCVNAIFLPLKYIQSESLPLFQLKLQLSVPSGRSCLSTGDSGFVIQSAIHVTCVFFAFCNMTLGSQEPVEFLDIGSFITKTVLRQLEYF